MIIYFVILGLVFLLGLMLKPNKNKKNKKFYLIIVFLLLAIVAAIRHESVGVDTSQFCNDYIRISEIDFKYLGSVMRYEYGFLYICKLLTLICSDPQILIVISSIFINFAVIYFIHKHSDDVTLSCLMYVLLNYYFMYMNAMRQAIALGIILIFLSNYLNDKKKLKYIFGVILASLFHSSSLIMLVIPFLNKFKFKKNFIFYTVVLSILILPFTNNISNLLFSLSDKYGGYSTTEFAVSNYVAAIFNLLVSLSFYILLMINYDKAKDKLDNCYFYLTTFNVFLNLLTISSTIFGRLAHYFSVYNIIIIPAVISLVKDKDKRIKIRYAICTFMFIYWLIIAIYRPEWYGTIPYKFFWEGY